MSSKTIPMRGRTVAPARTEQPSVDIIHNGRVVGTLYPRELTGRAQLDLEDAVTIKHLLAWLKTYAQCSDDDIAAIREELAEGALEGLQAFALAIGEAMAAAVRVPKQT